MIKFKYAIHKATQTLFTYENWLEYRDDDRYYNIVVDKNTKVKFKPMDMIMSDDFEIIYNEFTTDELEKIYSFIHYTEHEGLKDKLTKNIRKRKDIINRFGVDSF